LATHQLERAVFSTSRAAEFLDLRALQSQTGQPARRFGDVVLKELLDNALDAAESADRQPEIALAVEVGDEVAKVTVSDNGPGIPPETVAKILDFDRTVSDKAHYRSPTRGAQGNAFKTLLGIPDAFKLGEPVVIEACGVRHEILVHLDPGGQLQVRHDTAPSSRSEGTAVTVPLPVALDIDTRRWLQGMALVNPHATFIERGQSGDPGDAVFYKPSVGDGWSKPVPTNPTSPHHYDAPAMHRLVSSHIGAAQLGSPDMPLGAFLRSFDGLKSTARARLVAAALPGITHLSGFADRQEQVETLLKEMRRHTRAPKPAKLGRVGEDHFRALFDHWYGVEEFWYRRKELLTADGMPWVVEVAAARTHRPGAVHYGMNYSSTFDDPLTRTLLRVKDASAWGGAGWFREADAAPGHANGQLRAAAVHLICPAPSFLDKGKAVLSVGEDVAEMCAEALHGATKTLRVTAEKRKRDALRAARAEHRRTKSAEKEASKKELVFRVLPEAIDLTRGGPAGAPGTLPFSTRSLYYKVRPLLQRYTSKDLDYGHFAQTLVPEYQRLFGQISGLYYEPRGCLYEPHGGQSVPLGTLEVASYKPEKWLYDKILYVEKKGLWPVLRDSRLGDRYDMAIAAGEGYSTEACRELLADAAQHVKIFVLHDADLGGYNIARTLAGATARMPNHQIEVIDLGLTIPAAIELGLPSEAFPRKKALPAELVLNDIEREWFTGRPVGYDEWGNPNEWEGRRVELNAFSSPELIAHIEDGLARHGATAKVIPPQELLVERASGRLREIVTEAVNEVIADLLDVDALVDESFGWASDSVDTDVAVDEVREHLDDNRQLSWKAAVTDLVGQRWSEAEDGMRSRIEESVRSSIQRGEQDAI
jgi:hypothetical protein